MLYINVIIYCCCRPRDASNAIIGRRSTAVDHGPPERSVLIYVNANLNTPSSPYYRRNVSFPQWVCHSHAFLMTTPMPKKTAKVRPIAAARTILQERLFPPPLSFFSACFCFASTNFWIRQAQKNKSRQNGHSHQRERER